MIEKHCVWSEEVYIAASPEQVWSVLTDFPAYPEWNPFTSSVETSLEPGTPVKMRVHLSPPKSIMQTETVEWAKPGEEIAWGIVSMPWLLRARRTQRIRPEGEGCVYQTWDEFSGLARPLVIALMGKKMERGFNDVARALKQRCESLA